MRPHNEPKFPASAVNCQRRGGRNPGGSGDKDRFFEDRVPGIELDFFFRQQTCAVLLMPHHHGCFKKVQLFHGRKKSLRTNGKQVSIILSRIAAKLNSSIPHLETVVLDFSPCYW